MRVYNGELNHLTLLPPPNKAGPPRMLRGEGSSRVCLQRNRMTSEETSSLEKEYLMVIVSVVDS